MKKKKLAAMIGAGIVGVAAVTGGIIWGVNHNLQNKQKQQAAEDQNRIWEHWLELGQKLEEEVNTDVIYPGVTVLGTDLGGKTVDEAVNLIEDAMQNLMQETQVTLQYGDQAWKFSLAELEVSSDAKKAAERAFQVGRSGDLRQRKIRMTQLDADPETIEVETIFNESMLSKAVEEVASKLEQEPVDAVIQASGNTFQVTPEKKGLTLNQKDTVNSIKKDVTIDGGNKTIQLSVEEVLPEKTAEILSTIQDRIGSYSTYYSTSNYGREQNLIVGASKLNGLVVMPDEVVSFNSMVAPITVENGYHEANVIVGDEYVPGLGGGLCQVSTTLYNAVIRAELEVYARDCHAFPADYVPLGMDAAVAQGYLDFQFKNTSGHPIYISMWAGGGEIGAAIYGTEIHDPSRSISFDYVITAEIPKLQEQVKVDPALQPGQRVVDVAGHIGYEVDVYKTVTEKGSSYTEWFSSSSYMASADKVRVGPEKPKPAASASAQEPENSSGNGSNE